MLHKTKAIILRTTPYGETSLIVSAYTELFGQQSYMVKGARKVSKKGGSQSQMYQPGAILELVAYHNELKQLQMIKEARWSFLYQQVMSQVVKNAVALYIIELLGKCMRQPETNEELFAFVEQTLQILDEAEPAVTANLPLYFSLQLAARLGFRMEDNYSEAFPFLDLQEGHFCSEIPGHGFYLDGTMSNISNQLLQTDNPVTLYRLKLHKEQRRELLEAYEHFYTYHIASFGKLQTLQVLDAVL